MNNIASLKIEKEDILRFHIPRNEVLLLPEEISNRKYSLDKACQLGNSEKGKVFISFLTDDGVVEVYTTIWNVSRDHIVLKGGTLIPVSAILEVRF